MLDLAEIRCAAAAIEDTTVLGAQVPEVLAAGTAEAEALVALAVAGAEVEAGAGDKKTLDRENNEHQGSLQQILKNFCDRLRNRRFWISQLALAGGLRKEIQHSRELGFEKAKRI
jgi:hypothetical protein